MGAARHKARTSLLCDKWFWRSRLDEKESNRQNSFLITFIVMAAQKVIGWKVTYTLLDILYYTSIRYMLFNWLKFWKLLGWHVGQPPPKSRKNLYCVINYFKGVVWTRKNSNFKLVGLPTSLIKMAAQKVLKSFFTSLISTHFHSVYGNVFMRPKLLLLNCEHFNIWHRGFGIRGIP